MMRARSAPTPSALRGLLHAFPRVRVRSLIAATALAAGLNIGLAGCASNEGPRTPPGPPFQEIGYATWTDDEPAYRFYPGDQLEVTVGSAPELNRSLTVQPDGRITMPLIGAAMAADRTGGQLEAALRGAYASQLVDPRVQVAVTAATPIRVFVGGEVGKPGVYDMPGDINALQAVIMAGGLLTSGRSQSVAIIRRGADGRPMMRYVDLARAVKDASNAQAVPLRRFDIVFAPRSDIANVALFVQQYLRDIVPVQFSYAVGNGNYLTTR